MRHLSKLFSCAESWLCCTSPAATQTQTGSIQHQHVRPPEDDTPDDESVPDDGPVSVGPLGGLDGRKFDDGHSYDGIKQVQLRSGMGIDHIRVEYVKDGQSVWIQHGQNGGKPQPPILLDCPDEFLVSVWGYYGRMYQDQGYINIRSLTFKTNKKTHGPFGIEEGQYFSLSSSGCKIIGFHGKAENFLDSLGAHMVPQGPILEEPS
ncbi:hypothetical protein RJ639_008027 [Escallonia herrerae]|uniref:Jacalin-type lectin domain-containing protein n=1 Tax=Escallonia herrerae TaxID=1293975 RepID=A0AA88VWT8_9ASTE|nr:hypothetical protein RJ639_008027 [Escallonia herrerae]